MDNGIPLVARPPRSWETKTNAVLAAVAVFTVLTVVDLVVSGFVWHFLLTGGKDHLSPFVIGYARNAEDFALLLGVIFIGYVAAFIFWRKATDTMLRTVGDRSAPVATNWAVFAWRITVMVSIAISFLTRQLGAEGVSISTRVAISMAQGAIRVAGLVLLLIGVWQLREEIRERVAAAGIAFRFDRDKPQTSTIATDWAVTTATAADENFWVRVRDLATTTGADLALLDAAGPFAHRWLTVPASGDVSAVRADLEPGARVTIFAAPPAADFTPPVGEGPFHGYLDGTYRSVTAQRVPNFLTQAAAAQRWGLYSASEATALTATV